jgi:hypothetical protein
MEAHHATCLLIGAPERKASRAGRLAEPSDLLESLVSYCPSPAALLIAAKCGENLHALLGSRASSRGIAAKWVTFANLRGNKKRPPHAGRPLMLRARNVTDASV